MKHFITTIVFFSIIILTSCNKEKKNEPSNTTTTTTTPTIKKDYTLGSVTDICGNKYTYINFNGKTWMAQNMRCNKYDTKSEQSGKTLSTSTKNYAPCYIDASERYNWDEESKKNGTNLTDEQILQLGYLYSWSAAVGLKSYDEAKEKTYFSYTRQGICPNGWHIPTKSDWVESETNGKKLKSTTGWYNGDSEYKAGSDSHGFSALPAGYCSVSSSGSNYIKDLGTYAYFWTVDPEVTTGILGYKNTDGAFARLMGYSYDELFSISHTKTAALSVRCVKDEYQMSKVNLSLDKTEISIQVKTNTTITATTNTTDEIVWTTSNANIATITTDGKKCSINGIAVGEVEIKAEVAGVEAVCKVKVLSKESQTDNEDSGSDENIYDDIKSITLNKSELQLAIGQSEILVATVTNTSNVVISAIVDWTSLNPAIATVNNGEVTGVAPGETQVKASIAGKEAVCNVTVNAISESDINLYKKDLTKAYQGYNMYKYTEENWDIITGIYNTAMNDLGKCITVAEASNVNKEAKAAMEAVPISVGVIGTVTDICGNTYNYVQIGSQYWMAENMRCDKYDTESERASATISSSSSQTLAPYYMDASDKSNWNTFESEYSGNLSEEQISKLGYLYNWAAAVGLATAEEAEKQKTSFSGDRQGICPNGWHVPTKDEWSYLESYLGGHYHAGKKLQSTSGWYRDNGTDTYSFSLLPAGYAKEGSVNAVGTISYLWAATSDYNHAHGRCAGYDESLSTLSTSKQFAQSVRCVKRLNTSPRF